MEEIVSFEETSERATALFAMSWCVCQACVTTESAELHRTVVETHKVDVERRHKECRRTG